MRLASNERRLSRDSLKLSTTPVIRTNMHEVLRLSVSDSARLRRTTPLSLLAYSVPEEGVRVNTSLCSEEGVRVCWCRYTRKKA